MTDVGQNGGRRRSGCLLALTVALVVGLAGCGGSGPRQDLIQATGESIAAVRSGESALDLVQRGRTTRAHGEVVFTEMERQLTAAQKAVADAQPGTSADVASRDRTLEAVGLGLSAVLAGRDCLQLKLPCRQAADQLLLADHRLAELDQRLRGGQ